MKRSAALALLALSLCSLPLRAAVFLVPQDSDLIGRSDAIIVGTVHQTAGRLDAVDGLVTDVDIDVDDVLKGGLARTRLRMVEQGGVVGDRMRVTSAATNYFPSERVVVFLTRDGQSNWTTYGATLGKMTFVTDSQGNSLLVRGVTSEEIVGWDPDSHPHHERARFAAQFLDYIRSIAAGKPAMPNYFVNERGSRVKLFADGVIQSSGTTGFSVFGDAAVTAEPTVAPMATIAATAYPASAYLQAPIRWTVFDSGGSVTFRVNGSQPGYDSLGAAQRGLAAWTNDPSSNVDYRYGGTTTAGFVQDGINSIVFNAASGVPAGAIAYSQWYAAGSHVYKGESMSTTVEGDVIVKSGLSVSQTVLDEAVMHELGHTLGFRHSETATPASSTAIMYSVVSGRYGAVPQQWDRDALAAVYGSATVQHYADVPPTYQFYSYIENIYNHGIPNECSPGYYCPDSPMTRDMMAVWLERALNGGGAYVPPAASGTIFADVSKTTPWANFIEKFYADRITSGCAQNPLRYCPAGNVTRREMAVFLLRSKHGSAYVPPAATGVFSDVDPSDPFAAWVEQLYREGTTSGCAQNPLRYCPHSLVTRGEMAVFIVRNFGY